jgi:hypothetical protein
MAKLTKKPSKNTHIKKKASTQPIEEGILDSLRGGQTSQQKAVQQRFVSNFIGSLVSAVDNAIKAKVVDPKLTAKSSADADAEGSDAGSGRIEPTVPAADSVVAERHNNSKYEKLNKLFESILNEQQATPMSVSAYINNQFLPRYVSNWKSIPPAIRKRMTDLVRQLDGEKWNSFSRKSVLNTLAGLIYTNVSLPNRGPAGRQNPNQAGGSGSSQAGGSGSSQAGGSGSSQAGGSGSSQAGAMVHKDLTDLQKNWPNLSDEEKKKVKDYIASLT